MVGGRVIEVAEVPGEPGKLFIDVADRPYGKVETCAIYVEKNEVSDRIEIGDSLWWQGNLAMWTPQSVRLAGMKDVVCGVHYDIKIQRIGYSGVGHPSRREAF